MKGEILKNIYVNATIKKKLLLLFMVQILVPICIIGYLFFNRASEIIKTKSINYSQDILQIIELRFNDLAINIEGLTLELLYDNRVYSALNDVKGDSLELFEESSDMRNILRQAVLSKNEIQSICLFTQEGARAFSFDSGQAPSTIEDIIPYDKISTVAREGKGNLVWYLFKNKDDEIENIYVTRTIYNRDNYKEIGVMAIIIKKDYLKSIYKDLSQESLNNISILSEENSEILSESNNKETLLLSFFNKTLENRKGYYIDEDNKTLVSYLFLDNPKWKIVYHIPLRDLYKEIHSLRIWFIVIGVYGGVLLSILSILTSRDIVKPINKLVAAMREVEKGDKPAEIIVNRSDEVGYLSHRFNKMTEKIDHLVNEIYKEELALKEAEIKALQAQIDPHFLFNTLENINWMAQLNGVPEISETVTALGELMDAKIGRGDKMIPLREELSYIDNYMTVLKHRYEDGLELIKNINNELLDVKVPRLLIQPIVENALKHGVGKTTRKGIIRINIFSSSIGIRIEVIDNGLGMNEYQLNLLRNRLQEDNRDNDNNPYEAPEKSIGLENVNRRIRLIYGKECELKIESCYDEYTKVTMDIPRL